MRSSIVALDVASESSRELVAAAEAICAELASRTAPESGAVCMDLAQRLGTVTDSCEAALAGYVRRAEASGELLRWGYSSATGWLATSCGMRAGRAKERVTVSRQLPRLPVLAKRFTSSELSYGYTATICDAVAHLDDDDCAIAAQALMDLADEGHSAQTVAKAGARIGDIIDTAKGIDKPDPDTRRGHRKPWLTIADALDGGAFLRGYADPELRALLHAALDSLAKPRGAHDDRDQAQRNANAMKTLLSGGGRNWRATLIIDLAHNGITPEPGSRGEPDGLNGEPDSGGQESDGNAEMPDGNAEGSDGGAGEPGSDSREPAGNICEPGSSGERSGGAGEPDGPAGLGGGISARLIDGTPIPGWRARQIAATAGISTLILGPDGLLLYLGRTTRFVTPAQWRVIEARYTTCADAGNTSSPAPTGNPATTDHAKLEPPDKRSVIESWLLGIAWKQRLRGDRSGTHSDD